MVAFFLYICNMKQPNIIDNGHKTVTRFINVLIWVSISLSIGVFMCLILLFSEHEKVKTLKGKIDRDSLAIKSYKELLLSTTNNK